MMITSDAKAALESVTTYAEVEFKIREFLNGLPARMQQLAQDAKQAGGELYERTGISF